ncbi:MAG: PilZ domain-containing protein [Sphingomonas sp.]
MLAHFEERPPLADRRRSLRRALRLGADAGGEPITIHDLSLSGALLETSVPMLVGASFEVELPEAGTIEATVLWNSGEYYGCQFVLPISPAALSAALLQAEAQAPAGAAAHDPIAELKQLNAEVERLAWKMDNALRRLTKK